MTGATFSQNIAFPVVASFAANLIGFFAGVGRRDIRDFSPTEREDIGLTLADMSQIGARLSSPFS